MKNNVWVCLEQNDGKIAGVSFEMLSEARKLADQLSGKVGAVLMGAGVKELAKEGFDPKYGARPLRRAIQSKVEDAVAEKLLDGTLKEGDTAKLAVEDEKLVVTK